MATVCGILAERGTWGRVREHEAIRLIEKIKQSRRWYFSVMLFTVAVRDFSITMLPWYRTNIPHL